jgi:osmotically-inducible protein OsmY
VTLTGRVTSPAQVERAQRDAQSVNGVRDVNNELRSSVGNF